MSLSQRYSHTLEYIPVIRLMAAFLPRVNHSGGVILTPEASKKNTKAPSLRRGVILMMGSMMKRTKSI